jgi:hypothetical protein
VKETIKFQMPEGLDGTALFYPCSGSDLATPIGMFSPVVTDFWVVDRGYFSPGHQDTKRYGFDASADRIAPVLAGAADYELLGTAIRGLPAWPCGVRAIEPCVLPETYRHLPTGRRIKVRRRRGYGFSAFRQEIRQIGVFFYRGDSLGEGGSGNLWLDPKHVHELCGKLIDGGLIATDGSQRKKWRNWTRSGAYHQFSRFGSDECRLSPEELVKSAKPFADPWGRVFRCVGYAGQRYGPTLVWQVNKSRETRDRREGGRRTAMVVPGIRTPGNRRVWQ